VIRGRVAAKAAFVALTVTLSVAGAWAAVAAGTGPVASTSVPVAPMTAYAAGGPAVAGDLSRLPVGALVGGSSPSAAAQLGGGYDIAQRTPTGRLLVVGPGGKRTVFRTTVAPGSSPSIVGLYQGDPYEVAFQGRSGHLMIAAPGAGVRSLRVGVAAKTNPSIGASAGGCCDIAFHGTAGDLFAWTPATGARNTRQPVAAGTSPSLAEAANGAFEVAFHGAHGDLETWTSSGVVDTGVRIAAQSSPSIAALATGGYEIAFVSAAGRLSLLNSSARWPVFGRYRVAPGSSPSIAAMANGTWIVAFAGRTNRLLTEYANGQVVVSARQVAAGTSLAEAGSPPVLASWGPNTFGVASDGEIVGESAPTMARDLAYAAGTGAKWLRVDISWASIQQGGPRSFNWTSTDRVVRLAQARGMKILATLIYTPWWAEALRHCTLGDCAPNIADYANFARIAVAHYARLGVHAYEIWSEENITAQWLPRPNPAAYAAMLKASYPQIKRADPSAIVVTGGTSPSYTASGNYSPPAFVQALYKDGAKGYFDAIGVHPYTWPAYPGQPYSWSSWYQTYGAPDSVRSQMVANGDANKQIWGTEFGAATYGPKGSYVSLTQQSQEIIRGFALWSTYSWAGPLLVYEGRDEKSESHNQTMWNYLGLLLEDFSKKPSYAAYQQAAALY
jgi:hypothetical protein